PLFSCWLFGSECSPDQVIISDGYAIHRRRAYTPPVGDCVDYGCGDCPTVTITASTGTYGDNQIGTPGCTCATHNALWSIRPACDGLTSCNYTVSVATLGDCCPGYPKDFVAWYLCGSTLKSAYAPPEAGWGSVVTLSCP